MRKIYYVAMAMMLATMASCQKDVDLLNEEGGSAQVFYATFENGADTRTALDGSNNVIWSENDQISVFGGTSANTSFILDEGDGTTSGRFVMNSLVAATESNGAPTTLSANAAYYPYDNTVTVSESSGQYTFNATFPATQTYSESGTFGNGASPMVAVTASTLDANLKFKNVGAIFRLQLKGEATITKIVFNANADLAGECEITASNTAVPTVNVTEGSNSITLNCGEGVALNSDTPTNFIVAMLPVENAIGGMTIDIFDNAGMKMVYTYKESEPITIERSKAYSTAEVTYVGDHAVTAAGAQAALDNAKSGDVIKLEPNVNYGTLVFRQNADSRVVDITTLGGDAAGNEHFSTYENITILGAPGAVVDQIDFQIGWVDNSHGASFIEIKNLTLDGITFSGEKTGVNLEGSKGSGLGIDGLTLENCKMTDADGNNRLIFQQISGYKELNDKSTTEYVMTTGVKNLTINSCEVTGAYMVIESRAMENLTITNNTFNGIKQRDMLITSDVTNYPDAKYTGNITITGNTSTGGEERFIRASLNNGDATVTISNNTVIDYKGTAGDDNYDWIKVTGYTGTLTIENNTCSYTVSDAAALKNAVAAKTDGTILTLSAGTYNDLAFNNPSGYKATNLTIIGEEGTILNGFSVYDWSEESYITIDGLTFKNITFAQGLHLSAKVMGNVTVDGCDFIDDARILQDTKTEHLTNLVVTDCTFTGDGIQDNITALMLEHTTGLTVTGCTFTNIDYNVLQAADLSGTVLFDNNIINGTGDRVFRFDREISADITISNNTITSDGDAEGQLAKSTNAIEITLYNNTWNGLTDADAAADGKFINITAK